MSQLVCQALQLVRLEFTVIFDDVVTGGVNRPLADRLGDQEKVVPLWESDRVVDDSPTEGITISARPLVCEETGVDPFAHDNKGDHGVVAITDVRDGMPQFGQLVFFDMRNLPFSHAITVEEDSLGESALIVLLVLVQSPHEHHPDLVGHFGLFLVEVDAGEVPCEILVKRCNQSTNTLVLPGRVVISVISHNHRLLDGDLHSPGLSSYLARHLRNHLSGHAHVALLLVEDLGNCDNLAGDRLLNAAFLLY